MPYVKSINRNQLIMTTLDMLVDQDSIVRIIDAFVDSLDLQKLGFLFAEPDFRTISDFRKNNSDALFRVFHEFNKIFRSYLLNGFVSIDGSKFLSNSSLLQKIQKSLMYPGKRELSKTTF